MIFVKDVTKYINEIAPFDTKCEWDNCGMLVGESEKEVKIIGFALDLTPETLAQAIENHVDLIITHHPIIFRAQKTFQSGNMAFELAKNGISAISAHTCFDCADEGVNDVLARLLQLKNINSISSDDCVKPMLRVGEVESISSEDFAKFVAKKLDTTVRLIDCENQIKKVAVCGGAGMSFMYDVKNADVDCFVTGDISHHEMLDAKQIGLTVIAGGHFETENPAIPFLMSKVSKEFDSIKMVLLNQTNPTKFIG